MFFIFIQFFIKKLFQTRKIAKEEKSLLSNCLKIIIFLIFLKKENKFNSIHSQKEEDSLFSFFFNKVSQCINLYIYITIKNQ